jgi:uncharacterized phage-associated protein
MAVPSLSAARTVCELRNWSITNLELQKILYIAQMFHIGETEQPLVDEAFQAWDYGPVLPRVYSRACAFGNGPVRNVFHWDKAVENHLPEYAALEQAAKATEGMTAGKLVSITHWPDGAWAKFYRAGERGVIIPNKAIRDEFLARNAA